MDRNDTGPITDPRPLIDAQTSGRVQRERPDTFVWEGGNSYIFFNSEAERDSVSVECGVDYIEVTVNRTQLTGQYDELS